METIDGKKIAEEILRRVKKEIEKNHLKLKMAVVLIGNDPVSLSYISQKRKSAEEAGIGFGLHQFPQKIQKKELTEKINEINKKYSGTIIQLPLPSKFQNSVQEIMNLISEEKDIDILSEKRLGKFYCGDFSVLPPVVGAVSRILKNEKISLKEKHVVLVGFGRLVGKPLSFWFARQGVTLSIVNKSTPRIDFFTKKADILISGTGKPGLIRPDMVKKGVIAIDAGSSSENGEIKGDMELAVGRKALLFSPVPGGIGPVTSACLIENLLKLNQI